MTASITGTVRLKLAALADHHNVYPEVEMEIDLGNTWPGSVDLERLRMLAWRLGSNLALVGSNSAALAYAVGYLRERAGLDHPSSVERAASHS
jgi:hypothetical protein